MTEQDKKEIMNLIKAKKIIKQKEQTDDIWQEVMDKALAEIDRLKVELRNAGKVIEEYINKPSEASTDLWQRGYQEGFKQAKFDCEMDKLNEPKEITLREGLELMKKECEENEECDGDGKNCGIVGVCFNLQYPMSWDIDNMIKAAEKLKEENK